MSSVFMSYSHVDEAMRNQLEVHLSMLRRDGLITAWHDRRITAGSVIDNEIDAALETADVILLLVSPDFLASNYCYEREMKRALERHEAGEARVIPVILRECDWKNSPLGKLRATPTDGKPIKQWPDHDQAFHVVANDIRDVVTAHKRSAGRNVARPKSISTVENVAAPPAPLHTARSGNMRVRKNFTDQERDAFLEEAFLYIVTYIENSLAELQARNRDIQANSKRVDAERFTATIYRDGKSVSRCGIHLVARRGHAEITYSSSGNTDGGYNDSLMLKEDEQALFLHPSMSQFYGDDRDQKLSHQGAAELFWARLMEPLQR